MISRLQPAERGENAVHPCSTTYECENASNHDPFRMLCMALINQVIA